MINKLRLLLRKIDKKKNYCYSCGKLLNENNKHDIICIKCHERSLEGAGDLKR